MVSREGIGIIQDKALRFCSTLHHSCPFNEFIALWIEPLALGMLSKYSNTKLHPLPITFRLSVLIWFLWSGHLEEIADKPILHNSPIVYYKHNQKISLNYFLSLHMFKLLIFFFLLWISYLLPEEEKDWNEAFCKSALLWSTLRDTCAKAHLLAGMKAERELLVCHYFHRLYTKELWKPTRDSYLENMFNHFELYKLLLFYTFSRQTNHAWDRWGISSGNIFI